MLAGATIIGIANPVLLVYAREDEARAIEQARSAVKTSTESLISAKDEPNQNDEEKEIKKLAAAKETLKNVTTLGVAEIGALEKKHTNLEIEKLVTDDYTFDAVDINDKFAAGLTEGKAHYRAVGKSLERVATLDEIQKIAAELQEWRERIYVPLVKNLFSIELVLRQKGMVTMGNARFEKILNDLQRLKKAKLISLEAFEVVLRRATANQRTAIALHAEATQLLLTKLRGIHETIENQRITNLVEQSFAQVRQLYKQFMEVNRLLKELLASNVK